MKNLILFFAFVLIFSNFSYSQISSTNKLIIVSWDEWGRASKKCKGGGLCNAEWFYFSSKETRKYFSNLEFDAELKEYFFIIVLDEKSKKLFSEDELVAFPIDEDILLDMDKALGRDYIIPRGEYKFDNKLNGYRLVLK